MDIETEYEEMDTEEEESKVRKLTKEELEVYQQYKEFYTIQGRTKGKIPGFRYIHRLEVKEHYLGIPSDVADMLSHPIEGEVQDIDHITEQEVIEIEWKHAMVPWRWVNVRPKRKTVILCINPDSDSDVVMEEGEGDFKERCIMTNSLNSLLKQGLTLEHLWPLSRKLKTKMKPFPVHWPRISTEKRWKGSS